MNSTKCFLYGAKGKSKDRFAQNLKVANRSFSVVETLSGGSSKRIHARAAGGMIMPPKGSTQRGLPSGRFFGDFLIGEKVTQGPGLEAPPWGGAQRRASALLASVGEGPPVLHKSPRVWAG